MGVDDDIIPSSFTIEKPLGNLNECIITSGKLLLDLYYNLKRKVFSITEVKVLSSDIEVALYSLERLYAFKLWFRNSSLLNKKVIKIHMTFHFLYEILKTGCLRNTDSLIYEHLHVDVKHTFQMSSKRRHELVIEMWTRMQTQKLINLAVNRFNERFGNYPYPSRDLIAKMNENKYITKGGIQYSWSSYDSKRQQFKFDRVNRRLVPMDDEVKKLNFLNPLVELDVLWYEIQQIASLEEFNRRFMNGSPGYILINFDSILYNINFSRIIIL